MTREEELANRAAELLIHDSKILAEASHKRLSIKVDNTSYFTPEEDEIGVFGSPLDAHHILRDFEAPIQVEPYGKGTSSTRGLCTAICGFTEEDSPSGPIPIETLKELWGKVCDECLRLWQEYPRRAAEVTSDYTRTLAEDGLYDTKMRTVMTRAGVEPEEDEKDG